MYLIKLLIKSFLFLPSENLMYMCHSGIAMKDVHFNLFREYHVKVL